MPSSARCASVTSFARRSRRTARAARIEAVKDPHRGEALEPQLDGGVAVELAPLGGTMVTVIGAPLIEPGRGPFDRARRDRGVR